jgi:uncharacterized protein YgbK (DUF1537 family)
MPILGCVADDFTGATDLANTLVKEGARTVQLLGVPRADDTVPEADAIVVALKSRTAPVREAVAESVAALDWLLAAGCRQAFFKVCSTFDSTDAGNIGPVADALLARLGAGFAPVCPAFPTNLRTVYLGHLFVGSALLNESGMENHPLTPMRDANLVRVLGRQTQGSVGFVPFATVDQGAGAIRTSFNALRDQGRRYAIVDAITDQHLRAIGAAADNAALMVGGSGLAIGLPETWRKAGLLAPRSDAATLPKAGGRAAVVAGSCSRATLGQIGYAREHVPTLTLDPLARPDAASLAQEAIAWIDAQAPDRPVVVAASATPDRVEALQTAIGREAAGHLVERTLAEVADALIARGVRRLVVAGGETAGAVVSRLGVRRLAIGPEIDPGVPWTYAPDTAGGLHLALKSGNFGARDFFLKAFEVLEQAR